MQDTKFAKLKKPPEPPLNKIRWAICIPLDNRSDTKAPPAHKHMTFSMALPKREHKLFWEQFLTKRRTRLIDLQTG